MENLPHLTGFNDEEFFAQGVNNYTKKDMIIADANELIEQQEADKKHK